MSYRRGPGPLRRDPSSRCSLLLRNLPRDIREEDIRRAAEKYGTVRDIYIPLDYYTRQPRGIGFVEFTNPRDCEEAQYQMDRTSIHGREITATVAKEGRKRPEDIRRRGGGPPRRGYSPRRERSYSRSPRRRSYSRSPPRRERSRRRSYSRSRSRSPRSRSRSPAPARRSLSPVADRDHDVDRDYRKASPAPRDDDRSPRGSPQDNGGDY